MKNTLVSAAFAALFCLANSCVERSSYISFSGFAQGGTYTVKLNMAGVSVDAQDIKDHTDSLLGAIDRSLSGYNKGSLLSKFNRGESIVPDYLFRESYRLARSFYEKTGGEVDVTGSPLFDLWGFGFTRDSLPGDDKIKAVLGQCGMDRILPDIDSLGTISSKSIVTDGQDLGIKLNFNAIAQGYSCDVIARYLYSVGVRDMLVEIGEIYCDGHNPSGLPWTVAVDNPVDGNETPGADVNGVIRATGKGCGIVTSGNYRKFYIKDGKKYAHTIDPLTGYPVDHNLLSATIIAPTGAQADAYATYCMVIGLERAKEFIEDEPDLEGYLIFEDNGRMNSWSSMGLNKIR